MHHGASAYAYQHGRHQNDKHAQHGIGDIQSGPDPAWREKSDYCQQCDDDTQSQSDPSGVAACHGHVFDGTHMREGLRGDDNQRAQNNLRYRGEQFSWHGSSSRKANIADYRNIAPEYGTLDDFKAVLKGCKERGIKVIMDLVVNHTSTEHEWFQKSRMGGDDNPYKDYYFWRKGTGKDGKGYPNNWTSSFPGPAWTWDDERKEYYLHLFAVGQPDLNHDNPKVRQEVIDIYKYLSLIHISEPTRH